MLNPLRWVVEGVFMAQRHPLRFHTPCNPKVERAEKYWEKMKFPHPPALLRSKTGGWYRVPAPALG